MADALPRSQVDALEKNALDVLCVVRSIKNSFAPVNRIPPEVLSLIPDHFETDTFRAKTKYLINLTHVCRGWREIFISRASLWRFLGCTSLDQTRVCIQRSMGSLLEISLDAYRVCYDALLLVAPQIGRLKALFLSGITINILDVAKVLCSPAPLLEQLEIQSCALHTIENTLFDGDFSSLRELRFSLVVTSLPWRDLSNLTTFYFLQDDTTVKTSVTQLLTFFERAPLLRRIKLLRSLPYSSDAPSERMVSLPRLGSLGICGDQPHSILLNHLHIPTGASVTLDFSPLDRNTEIQDYLPRSLEDLNNISHITSIWLNFKSGMAVQLEGPSGSLYLKARVRGSLICPAFNHQIESLSKFPISTTKALAIHQYRVSKIKVRQTLLIMNNLRTLNLTDCINISFFLALNPALDPSNTVVCPQLKKLVLRVQEREELYTDDLLEMAEERALAGAKLSAILITSPCGMISGDELSSLRRHASRVEHIVR